MSRTRYALISVYDKTGIVEFARSLVEMDWVLISTGGTAKKLESAGLTVMRVSDLTGFPEILGGRVKTLHPGIHGGILADDSALHRDDLEAHDIAMIDMVVCNLYPFAAVVRNGADMDTALENIDIGGPTMIRAAAKNHPRVLVVTNPMDYDDVSNRLRDGRDDLEYHRYLAELAFCLTAEYDDDIYRYFYGHRTGE